MVSGTAGFRPLSHFDGARRDARPADRLKDVRYRAAALREEMLSVPPVPYYRSFDLVRVPYPVRYGLRDAAWSLSPMMHIVNRMFVVQFTQEGVLKTLLMSPTDVQGSRKTPYFERLAHQFRIFGERGRQFLAPVLGSVESCLSSVGIAPQDVDYLSYDHLHTQDLRRWIGPGGFFPRARLLIMRQEWESARGLLPTQADWYCPHGLDGIDPARVVLLDQDVLLGEGVALIRTPGHTEGNHSFVVRTPEGLMVTSENGVGPDAYAPLASSIPGVRAWARDTGSEVVLNGNTLESSVDQYVSMVCEKEIAGRSVRNDAFYNVVSSSEFSAYWAFPLLAPTFAFGPLCFGSPSRT